jgi:hypothetical protein
MPPRHRNGFRNAVATPAGYDDLKDRYARGRKAALTQAGFFEGTFSRRWLNPARAAWIVLACAVILLNWYGLFLIIRMTATACNFEPCYSYYQITPRSLAELQAAGMNVGFVIAVRLASSLFSVLAWTMVGLVLFWRRSAEKPVYFVSLMLITLGSAAFGPMAAVDEMNVPVLQDLAQIILVIGQISFVFLYIFPDGRFYPSWTRVLALIWTAAWVPALFSRAYNPFDSFLQPVIFTLFIASVIAAQGLRFRSITDPLLRQQVKWVIYSTILAFSFFLIYLTVIGLLDPNNEKILFATLAELVLAVVMGGIPLSMGIAMLRYRLWDIDFLIRRTLGYAVVTLVLAGIYAAVVIVLQTLLRGLIGQESQTAVTVSTLAIATLFHPLRVRVQQIIDRRFYRARYDAQQILESFNAASRSEVNLENLSSQLLNAADETMQPVTVSLWLKKGR